MSDDNRKIDLHCQIILNEFIEKQSLFEKMHSVVLEEMRRIIKDNNLSVTAVEGRIKTQTSLIGKLILKGHKYQSLYDITDILGTRIITLFSDDVDRVASYMEKTFDVDWKESIDKRKTHQLDSFGYNSLHYICRIPKSLYFNSQQPELNDLRFEIQMRSTLQHAWAAMNHDIGYKSEIETPPEYLRMLGRLAGMLELADEEFSRIRISVAEYRRHMEALIKAGELSQVQLDGDTFKSYIAQKPFEKLTKKIAAINQAEVQEMSFDPYFPLLKEIGIKTLQDLEDFIKENEDDAYKFAMSQLGETDLDIVASTIGLQNLIIVATLKNGGGKAGLKHVFDELYNQSAHNESLAQMVFKQASKLLFMNKQ